MKNPVNTQKMIYSFSGKVKNLQEYLEAQRKIADLLAYHEKLA
jgi:hypothetical protein